MIIRKYRILKDGELYYPQKRWYFIWTYFKDYENKHLWFTDYERANDMIEIEKWLKTQEQDALVQISVNIPGGYESYTAFREFDPDEHSYYYENLKILELGDD